ncbi:MAG: ribonuclease Z [Acidobacteria bacterium]|nr:ribonuclease Z [Acidobacteriota bacterium]
MDFLFLGTSSGTPTRTRNVTGLAMRSGRRWILIDCGEGIQYRLMHSPLSPVHLEAVLITHLHGDHVYGLPGLLGSMSMLGRKMPLVLVGPAELEAFLKPIIELTQLRLSFPLLFKQAGPDLDLELLGHKVSAIELSHRIQSFAYGFTEKSPPLHLNIAKLKQIGVPDGPILGQLKRGETVVWNGQALNRADYCLPQCAPLRFAIGGDNDQPQRLAEFCQGADLLVHEATYLHADWQKVGPGPMHSSAQMVAEMAQACGLRQLVLTHFSPRYADSKGQGSWVGDLKSEATQHFSGPVFLAFDGAHFDLDAYGNLQSQPSWLT